MAPKTQDPKGGSGKGKITVVMFQLEGSDETLQDAIKVLGQGIEKLAPGAPIYRMLQTPAQARPNGALPAGPQTLAATEAEILEPEENVFPDEGTASSQSGSAERPRQQKKRIQKAIVAVTGIDWDTGTGFKEYANQKKPDSIPTRFLVVAGWFKTHRATEIITPGHIVAAFDVMDWPKPENIPNTFAWLKTKKGKEQFGKGEKPNEWVISQRGINALDRLGKGKSE